MKRILPFLLIFILTSCAQDNVDISGKMAGVTSIDADVSALFPDRVSDYRIIYTVKDKTVEVLEPQEVSGIRARIGERMTFEFEDMILETGFPPQVEVCPINVLAHLNDSWQNVQEIGHESGAYLAISREGDFELRTRFSKDALLPLDSEIFYKSQAIMLVRYNDLRF